MTSGERRADAGNSRSPISAGLLHGRKADRRNLHARWTEHFISPLGLVTSIRACGFAGGQVARGMKKLSHKGYRFPLEIIQQAIWLYVRFTLSFRDVEVSWSKWRPLKRSSMLNMRVSFVAGRICRPIMHCFRLFVP
jgi:hypothetical protein